MTIENEAFEAQFKALTGHSPFQWQSRFFREWLARGRIPTACDLPTGLGKTSIMALWLIACNAGVNLPRRLIYVVDRRAVVDQATQFADTLSRTACEALGMSELPVSTLRGQHVDNRRWLENPAEPAIVVGTIDMIGSRLLFSGYGVSRGMRPYHAGLLGVDSLVLLDEAHLCRPFEAMLETLVSDSGIQSGATPAQFQIPPPHLLPLSATGRRTVGERFGLTKADSDPHVDPEVAKRVAAEKRLTVNDLAEASRLAEELARIAAERATESGPARVLVYCNSRETADKVKSILDKRFQKTGCASELLVGARRVRERERLQEWLETNGFLGNAARAPEQPGFLVATSAGEVGVDLDADHMVSDLVTWERMIQRLGRVNRRGNRPDGASIDIVAAPAKDVTMQSRLDACRQVLSRLPADDSGSHNASPNAIDELKTAAINAPELSDLLESARSAEPLYPALTRALVDAWSLTSLKQHTGRPDIAPWLRGWTDDEPQTTVAWRQHLPWRSAEPAPITDEATRYLELAPIHLAETLEAPTSLVFDRLIRRAQTVNKARHIDMPDKARTHALPGALVYDSNGEFQDAYTIAKLADLGRLKGTHKKRCLDAWHGRTVVVSTDLGGLNDNGMLDTSATSEHITALDKNWTEIDRVRVGYQLIGPADVEPDSSQWKRSGLIELAAPETTDAQTTPGIRIFVLRIPNTVRAGDQTIASGPQLLETHHAWAADAARELAADLGLTDDLTAMLVAAAANHDLGKRRQLWQIAMNAPPGGPYAKTAGSGDGRRLNGYRHEFGSLCDAQNAGVFNDLTPALRELGLHLIAAHHGFARPTIRHFDPQAPLTERETNAREAAQRFARLQHTCGPWGLAWWESLLRAVDHKASRRLDEETAQ